MGDRQRKHQTKRKESVDICELTKCVCLADDLLLIPRAIRQTESKSLLEYIKQRHSSIQCTAGQTVCLKVNYFQKTLGKIDEKYPSLQTQLCMVDGLCVKHGGVLGPEGEHERLLGGSVNWKFDGKYIHIFVLRRKINGKLDFQLV